ncbi:hypothetical protein ACLBSM_15395, partial [Klebsiella pneumoniae]
ISTFDIRSHGNLYTSGSICPPPALDFNLLNLISDGYYEKINFTELTTLAHSVDISLISDVKNVTNTGVAEYNDN